MAAVSQLSIFNRARVKAGESVVADLTPIDDTMRAFLASYEDLVLEELEVSEWAFSLAQATPTVNAINVLRSLPYQYAVPPDSLGIVGVRWMDQPLEGRHFRIEGNGVWTRWNSGITFLYKTRPGEQMWPRRFSDIIVDRLTAIAMQLTERHSEAQTVLGNAERNRIRASHAESRQRHNRPIGQGSIVNRRRGGGLEEFTNLPDCGGAANNGGNVQYLQDNDIFITADYTVKPGDGYVEADCSAGGGVTITVTYDATDATLNKVCVFRKKTDLGTLILLDPSTGGEHVFEDHIPHEFRRAFGVLHGPYG
jgi:hypothetical protein